MAPTAEPNCSSMNLGWLASVVFSRAAWGASSTASGWWKSARMSRPSCPSLLKRSSPPPDRCSKLWNWFSETQLSNKLMIHDTGSTQQGSALLGDSACSVFASSVCSVFVTAEMSVKTFGPSCPSLPTRIYNRYSGSMKNTKLLDHIRHGKTASVQIGRVDGPTEYLS